MISYVLQGFLLMGSMIVAIGAQNAFVLRQGLQQNHVFWVALVCWLCDVLLCSLGIFGMGLLIQKSPMAMNALALLGAIFLFWYGLNALKRALKPQGMNLIGNAFAMSRQRVLMQTLAVTLLNPHVYLDTVVIVGGIGATLNTEQKLAFLGGGMTMSALWFFGLAYGSRLLLPLFRRPATWRVLDMMIAAVMWLIAWSLLRFVYQSFS